MGSGERRVPYNIVGEERQNKAQGTKETTIRREGRRRVMISKMDETQPLPSGIHRL